MGYQTSLLWFRNDLRLHDNEALHTALQTSKSIVPIYILDPRHFIKTRFGFVKTGPFRAHFLFQSLQNLNSNLEALGNTLHFAIGKPEECLPNIAKEVGAEAIYHHLESTSEEVAVEKALLKNLPDSVKLHGFWGSTLFHPFDLPFHISKLPDVFTEFRKQVEKRSKVRPVFPSPQSIPSFKWGHSLNLDFPSEYLPKLPPESRGVMGNQGFEGGESAALRRLQHYLWETENIVTYKETRNGLLGESYSSKFSPWLANGSLSARKVYREIKRFEEQRISNQSTYWLIFELIWRDYFRFYAAKHGNQIFYRSGIKQELRTVQKNPTTTPSLFEAWRDGNTGFPFIDANMRELKQTGFMSNRGRQNVASFLVHDLGLDWRMGAEYFESILIDYDVCSNYGNWNYVAGVGSDPRENRYFNVIKQSHDYDPQGEYIRTWIPELTSLSSPEIHFPYASELSGAPSLFEPKSPIHYPKPIVRQKYSPPK
ncbi:MAG: DASH family cryptochrome [Chloroherpetonaceae bacterium]|nr:DASH family cryptochrome [Chloroherpetonaceae bacterium]